MFEFLFKKPGDKPGDAPAGQSGQPVHDASAPSAGKPDRALQAEKVGALAGDEAAAVEFILQSD